MILGAKSQTILSSGAVGWVMANLNWLFQGIQETSAAISTVLGIIILIITAVTGFFNARIKYLEYRSKKRENDREEEASRDPP